MTDESESRTQLAAVLAAIPQTSVDVHVRAGLQALCAARTDGRTLLLVGTNDVVREAALALLGGGQTSTTGDGWRSLDTDVGRVDVCPGFSPEPGEPHPWMDADAVIIATSVGAGIGTDRGALELLLARALAPSVVLLLGVWEVDEPGDRRFYTDQCTRLCAELGAMAVVVSGLDTGPDEVRRALRGALAQARGDRWQRQIAPWLDALETGLPVASAAPPGPSPERLLAMVDREIAHARTAGNNVIVTGVAEARVVTSGTLGTPEWDPAALRARLADTASAAPRRFAEELVAGLRMCEEALAAEAAALAAAPGRVGAPPQGASAGMHFAVPIAVAIGVVSLLLVPIELPLGVAGLGIAVASFIAAIRARTARQEHDKRELADAVDAWFIEVEAQLHVGLDVLARDASARLEAAIRSQFPAVAPAPADPARASVREFRDRLKN